MTDTNAINRDFEKYDQVRKTHTYRLAENETDEFDEEYRIATLDFGLFLHGSSKDRAQFAEEFADALQDIGFAVLTGHGVDLASKRGRKRKGRPFRARFCERSQ